MEAKEGWYRLKWRAIQKKLKFGADWTFYCILVQKSVLRARKEIRFFLLYRQNMFASSFFLQCKDFSCYKRASPEGSF